ncbi:putative cyclin-dependent kinase CMGC-CDK-Pl family [Helianthus annuus]|uniref:cyclin-dependent kinase n=1 Tax=Helianthus annuus TaxID=4232 RepID=A0A9K3IRM7_HELAN|nr:putative cyclin-dependent kinase CMGC-CDK-Pl family [Helianthus annuus]KAJ0566050.1 putative cyclin-dependent kinase CMGC-CDK-Pl family [Helianthus annuus]KAJ0572901.1 putative cyclin-dependent kinase CMGC-CDK-Pl family [Helianthus annuus]KAJ0911111.1 putative cyclin-dependent kinase CMGC-CDK-Pl family [Helianthus annuus]
MAEVNYGLNLVKCYVIIEIIDRGSVHIQREYELKEKVTDHYRGGQRRNVGKEILHRIAEGAYRVVYKAKDTESEQIVALKVIKTIKDDGIDATTLRGIGILETLKDSSHVVRFIDIEQSETEVTIALKYLEKDLDSYKDNQPLPHNLIQSFMYQLLEGVVDCHSVGTLHRDLKPKNLLGGAYQRCDNLQHLPIIGT